MNDEEKKPTSDLNTWLNAGAGNVKLIYILYLIGFVIGISAIVGVVFAHVNRGQSDEWIETHYTYLIRTFWIGLLYFGIGFFLLVALIGIPILFAVAVWIIVRCVIGLMKVANSEPISNPQSWWV